MGSNPSGVYHPPVSLVPASTGIHTSEPPRPGERRRSLSLQPAPPGPCAVLRPSTRFVFSLPRPSGGAAVSPAPARGSWLDAHGYRDIKGDALALRPAAALRRRMCRPGLPQLRGQNVAAGGPERRPGAVAWTWPARPRFARAPVAMSSPGFSTVIANRLPETADPKPPSASGAPTGTFARLLGSSGRPWRPTRRSRTRG